MICSSSVQSLRSIGFNLADPMDIGWVAPILSGVFFLIRNCSLLSYGLGSSTRLHCGTLDGT